MAVKTGSLGSIGTIHAYAYRVNRMPNGCHPIEKRLVKSFLNKSVRFLLHIQSQPALPRLLDVLK